MRLKENMDYLTHYTNVEALEKILSTKLFKFNAAKNLNDELEGKSRDSDIPTEHMTYSSSWCEDISNDGIDYMWNNYAKRENGGIRLFAPKYIFKKYIYNHRINKPIETHLPIKYHEEFMPVEGFTQHLYKIKYTDNIDKIFPSIKLKDKDWDQYKIFELGKYKEMKWSIEREWRYCLILFNRGLNNVPKHLRTLAIQQCYPESIFVEFRYSVYKKMIVQIGRGMTNENRERLNNLSKKYKFKIIDID
ncbi:MAG: hypothetical protein RR942_01110 [Romboutsia sp.]